MGYRTTLVIWLYFYPRPPRGGRRILLLRHLAGLQFLSTPSARRATLPELPLQGVLAISIHALREEGDPPDLRSTLVVGNFYPRPPRGGRPFRNRRCCTGVLFLSTPSARRATTAPACLPCTLLHFYPRPPRGGRPGLRVGFCRRVEFLSTPSARRATKSTQVPIVKDEFLSTPSARRATRVVVENSAEFVISIHALREEGDISFAGAKRQDGQFLSTPSARRATVRHYVRSRRIGISIHALREEGDAPFRQLVTADLLFLSTPSARRATLPQFHSHMLDIFLSTPSARRATFCRLFADLFLTLFLSTPSARRATQ